ncbi:hypothetical protein EOS_38180 [Caballeronia mineralivorans PML1(12)]|uniref:Purine nucleoside phosphorylase n=1 Tax=Caballeronia mineralivorans PML1(12) TaxID=908627 RepID=A0A0J1CK69_9BURK|nr:DUF4148 domain-containing protein [Caballeronia mineralivorans]KLU21092.1 hypothetical protein EOS_38180 [Caballeronia mineralivorans PML1(12)]
MLKPLISASLVTTTLVVHSLAVAQVTQPVTRAQLENELAQLREAGYRPSTDKNGYPYNIEAAEARLRAQNGVANTSYGSMDQGSVSSSSSGPDTQATRTRAASN